MQKRTFRLPWLRDQPHLHLKRGRDGEEDGMFS